MKNDAAKSEILSSIRRNLAVSRPFDAVHSEHQAHQKALPIFKSAIVTGAELKHVSLIERFRENLISIGGNCEVVANSEEASRLIQTIIEKAQAVKIAISDAPLIQNLKIETEVLRNASAEMLFNCDLGITAAQIGIAETGTLVLESDKEFNRLTSLVPPVHVCMLEAKNIVRSLGEVLEILEKDLSRAITFITGPSRTSDIELTLAIGVHGPAELFVILIDEKEN